MGLSQLALSIAESPTLKLNEAARLLRAKGEAVINLGIGEPKNKTPEAAIASASAVLCQGEVKYSSTDGTPGLKWAIQGYTEANYGRAVSPANIVVSSGAKQSLFNLLYALLDPQDEVVLLAPYWVSYPEMIRMCRGVPVWSSRPPTAASARAWRRWSARSRAAPRRCSATAPTTPPV